MGVSTRRPRERKPTQRAQAIRYLRQRVPARTVARMIGVNRNTVNRWRKEAQLGDTLDRIVDRIRKLTPEDRARLLTRLQGGAS